MSPDFLRSRAPSQLFFKSFNTTQAAPCPPLTSLTTHLLEKKEITRGTSHLPTDESTSLPGNCTFLPDKDAVTLSPPLPPGGRCLPDPLHPKASGSSSVCFPTLVTRPLPASLVSSPSTLPFPHSPVHLTVGSLYWEHWWCHHCRPQLENLLRDIFPDHSDCSPNSVTLF